MLMVIAIMINTTTITETTDEDSGNYDNGDDSNEDGDAGDANNYDVGLSMEVNEDNVIICLWSPPSITATYLLLSVSRLCY